MNEDIEGPKSRALDLENYLQHARTDVIERDLQQDLERKVDSLARSYTQTSTITAFAGMSLALLNLLVSTNLGWSYVWTNAVLVYLLGFGYLVGIFLVGYAVVRQRVGRSEVLKYQHQATKSLMSRIELMRTEDDLKRIHDEVESENGVWKRPLG